MGRGCILPAVLYLQNAHKTLYLNPTTSDLLELAPQGSDAYMGILQECIGKNCV